MYPPWCSLWCLGNWSNGTLVVHVFTRHRIWRLGHTLEWAGIFAAFAIWPHPDLHDRVSFETMPSKIRFRLGPPTLYGCRHAGHMQFGPMVLRHAPQMAWPALHCMIAPPHHEIQADRASDVPLIQLDTQCALCTFHLLHLGWLCFTCKSKEIFDRPSCPQNCCCNSAWMAYKQNGDGLWTYHTSHQPPRAHNT